MVTEVQSKPLVVDVATKTVVEEVQSKPKYGQKQEDEITKPKKESLKNQPSEKNKVKDKTPTYHDELIPTYDEEPSHVDKTPLSKPPHEEEEIPTKSEYKVPVKTGHDTKPTQSKPKMEKSQTVEAPPPSQRKDSFDRVEKLREEMRSAARSQTVDYSVTRWAFNYIILPMYY